MSNIQFVEITRNQKVEEDEFQTMMNRMYEQIWNNLLPPQILTDDLTIKTSSNLITPVGAPIPDCETCGACCIALPCVGVLPNDKEISPADYWDVTVKGASGDIVVDRFLRRNGETFACHNLDGIPGEKVSCRIYEQRPHTCHSFEAGSDKCHALRRAYGFEPFLSLMEMFYAQQKLKNQPEKFQPSEVISYVNIVENAETGNLEIKATLKDRSTQVIHTYDPEQETWRQFQFEGLPLIFVKDLIESRKSKKTE